MTRPGMTIIGLQEKRSLHSKDVFTAAGLHFVRLACWRLLWQGKLAVLDVGPSGPLHALLHEGTQPLRTVYEEDFGTAVADLLLLQQPYRRRRSLKAAQRLEAQRWHRLIQSQQDLAACSADTTGVFVSY